MCIYSTDSQAPVTRFIPILWVFGPLGRQPPQDRETVRRLTKQLLELKCEACQLAHSSGAYFVGVIVGFRPERLVSSSVEGSGR